MVFFFVPAATHVCLSALPAAAQFLLVERDGEGGVVGARMASRILISNADFRFPSCVPLLVRSIRHCRLICFLAAFSWRGLSEVEVWRVEAFFPR